MANNSQKKKITVNKFTLEVRKEKKKKQDLLQALETAIWQLWPSGKPRHLGICAAFRRKENPGPHWPPLQPIAIFLLPEFAYISMHI